MFLASDRVIHREQKIRRFLSSEPGLALILAAVNFEWTMSRAILFLSKTANAELRRKMLEYHSPDKYKDLWKEEVVDSAGVPRLPSVIRNWSNVLTAFKARNRLVHGKDRYTRNMATPHIEALLAGVQFVDRYCEGLGAPLYGRMPIRRSRPRLSRTVSGFGS